MDRHKIIILVFAVILAFFSGVAINGFASFDGTITFSIGPEEPVWSQEISNVSVNQNSSEYTVDSDLTASGNGYCSGGAASLVFTIQSENTSEVNCSISGVSLSITPASSFTGGASCIVGCTDGTSPVNETFTITVNAVEEEAEEPAPSRGGAGGGIITQEISSSPNFEVFPEVIKAIMSPGQKATKYFYILNKASGPITFGISLKGLGSMVLVPNSKLVGANTEEEVKVNLIPKSSQELGIYSGEIIVNSNEYKKIVTIVIDLESRPGKIPLKVSLNPDQASPTLQFTGKIDLRSVIPGELIRPHLFLDEFISEGIKELDLTYQIIDSSNQIIIEQTEKINVTAIYVKGLKLSSSIEPGRYVLAVFAEYGGETSRSSQTFEVVSPDSLIKTEFIIAILIILMIIGAFHSIHVRKVSRKLKRSR